MDIYVAIAHSIWEMHRERNTMPNAPQPYYSYTVDHHITGIKKYRNIGGTFFPCVLFDIPSPESSYVAKYLSKKSTRMPRTP